MEQTETPLSSSYSNLENIDKPFHSNVICTYIYFTSKFSLCNEKIKFVARLHLRCCCVYKFSIGYSWASGRPGALLRPVGNSWETTSNLFAPLPFNFGNLCMCTKVFSSFATIAEVRFSIQTQKKNFTSKHVEFPNKVQVLKRLLHCCQLLHWIKGGRKKVLVIAIFKICWLTFSYKCISIWGTDRRCSLNMWGTFPYSWGTCSLYCS